MCVSWNGSNYISCVSALINYIVLQLLCFVSSHIIIIYHISTIHLLNTCMYRRSLFWIENNVTILQPVEKPVLTIIFESAKWRTHDVQDEQVCFEYGFPRAARSTDSRIAVHRFQLFHDTNSSAAQYIQNMCTVWYGWI